jgi:hypothetical protein
VEPVNEIPFTIGWVTRVSPIADPDPVIIFKTPGGNPASSNRFTRFIPLNGVEVAGLKTMVFPQIRAGAIFQEGIAKGKFQGVIIETTPMGRRVVYARVLGNSDGVV